MFKNVVEENRKRDLLLKDTDGDVQHIYFIPQGWCDDWSYAAGFTGGLDWTPDHADTASGPEIYCYAPTHTVANSPVDTLFVLVSDLEKMEEVTEAEAMKIHPALFEYRARLNAE